MKNKVYFENLDALRTIACLSVFLSHSRFKETLQSLFDNDFYRRCIGFFSTGATGVSFFFVLSGFLITYLILNEHHQKGIIDIKNFYIRRVLRIWPLFYFVIIFGFFIYPIIKGFLGIETNLPNNIWYQLSFLSNFDAIFIHQNDLVKISPMMLEITWSVSIEEQFYLFWPLFFFLIPKRYYLAIPILTITISIIFRFLNSNIPNYNYYHTLSVMADLGIGGLFAYFSFYHKKFVNFLHALPKYIIILSYLLGMFIIMYPNLVNNVLGSLNFLYRLLTTCFFIFIILEQNYCKNSILKYHKIKPFSAFGKYTYSMYMLHPIGIQVSIVLYKIINWDVKDSFFAGTMYMLIALICSLLLSFLSFHYYEKPFLQLKNKFTS